MGTPLSARTFQATGLTSDPAFLARNWWPTWLATGVISLTGAERSRARMKTPLQVPVSGDR
jgi:hypothetical protein